ncbi:MAG TPA: hypothetical protein VGC50_12310 [Gammaproteobacteria bacterium]|jgi:hypothetical protein
MRKHGRHDYDDGFDEEPLFDDEELTFELVERQRVRKPQNDPPRVVRSEKPPRNTGRADRRRELASANAWGTPY